MHPFARQEFLPLLQTLVSWCQERHDCRRQGLSYATTGEETGVPNQRPAKRRTRRRRGEKRDCKSNLRQTGKNETSGQTACACVNLSPERMTERPDLTPGLAPHDEKEQKESLLFDRFHDDGLRPGLTSEYSTSHARGFGRQLKSHPISSSISYESLLSG